MTKRRTPVVCGNARFTVYRPGCVRLEYAKEGAFSPYPSVLVGRSAPRAIAADVHVTRRTVRIRTERFALEYRDNGEPFSPENLRIIHRDHTGNKQVWVPGKKDAGNLGSVRRSLDRWQWCGGPAHYPVEGLLSTEGGHLLPDEALVYWNTEYEWPQHLAHVVDFDGYFFAYGSDYKGALEDFVNVFGRIPMVPRWTFGFWYSRWYAYKDRDFVELAERYRREGIPLDVMIIDTDWRDGWGGYDWSKKYFPRPEKTIKELRDMGLVVSLNDHPGYDAYDALPDTDSHIPEIARRLGALPHLGQWSCDWSRREAVETWKDVLLGPFFDQGIDFWWIDGWIRSPMGALDGQLWSNMHYYELAEEKTDKRGMILSRWGGIGSHRYPVQFSGDTASEWGVLQHQIEFTARSANLGAVYWSHDIGGFFGREVDEELYIRWFQFGAMSPVFRTHSDHGIREPWKFSRKLRSLFRKQTRIRCALAPYFYTLAREAYDKGLPIVRPLYLEYNENDGGALHRKHQFTIGTQLLVVPADGPTSPNTGLYRKRVYFPVGRWFGLETGEVVQGTQDGTIDIPIEYIPTYVQEGAILPCQRVGDTVGTGVPEDIEFDYYPHHLNPSEFVLYEDDGATKEFEKGRYATTRVRGKSRNGVIEFAIGAPKGSYTGQPRRRTFTVRVRLEPGQEVREAECRVGRGPWSSTTAQRTPTCLAGEVQSKHSFCEVSASSSNQPVQFRIKLC